MSYSLGSLYADDVIFTPDTYLIDDFIDSPQTTEKGEFAIERAPTEDLENPIVHYQIGAEQFSEKLIFDYAERTSKNEDIEQETKTCSQTGSKDADRRDVLAKKHFRKVLRDEKKAIRDLIRLSPYPVIYPMLDHARDTFGQGRDAEQYVAELLALHFHKISIVHAFIDDCAELHLKQDLKSHATELLSSRKRATVKHRAFVYKTKTFERYLSVKTRITRGTPEKKWASLWEAHQELKTQPKVNIAVQRFENLLLRDL